MEVITVGRPEEKQYYAFTRQMGHRVPIYHRTFGTREAVMKWMEDHKDEDSFFTVNCLPRDYYR